MQRQSSYEEHVTSFIVTSMTPLLPQLIIFSALLNLIHICAIACWSLVAWISLITRRRHGNFLRVMRTWHREMQTRGRKVISTSELLDKIDPPLSTVGKTPRS